MDKRIGWLAIAWVVGMGTVVLLGWQFDIDWIKRGVADGPATMKANTAVCFLLSGVALGLLQIQVGASSYRRCDRGLQVGVIAAALVVMSIGGLTLAQYLGGWEFGIDQALFQDPLSEALTPFPGRMAINTAGNFILIGVVLLLLLGRATWQVWLAQLLSGFVVTISTVAFLGYLFKSQVFYTVLARATGMAVHTALTFGILALGLLAVRSDQGLMQPLSSPLVGGRMARQVLPWIIVCPIGLSYVLIQAEQAGWYDHRFGHVLETSILIVAFSVLLWRNTRSLNQSEQELLHVNQALEQRVIERTQILTQLNQRLHRSEARLHDILNTAIASITISRLFPDGRIIYEYRSAGSEAIFGYTADELMATPILWRSRVFADDWDTVIQPAQQQIPAESAFAYEYRFRHQDGSIRWIASTQTSRWNALEACWIITSVDVDITRRKLLEDTLRQSEAKLTDLVNSVHAVLASMRLFGDRTWHYEYWSSGCEKVYGYTQAEFLADPTLWLSRVYAPDRTTIIQPLIERLFAEATTTIEYRFRCKDGTLRWMNSSYTSRRDDSANCWIVTVVDTDITAHKQLEAALRESEEKFRQLVDNLNEVFWISEPWNQRLIYVSPAFETIWGISADQVYDNWHLWLEAIHPDDRPHIGRCISNILHQEYDEEYRLVGADGTIRWIRDRGFPIRDSDGQIRRIAGIAEDITQRKHAAVALQQRAKQEYGLRQITDRIRRSLDLADVLQTTVIEVQQLINADRVLIYQLRSDGTGTIRAATVAEGQPPISDRDLPLDLIPLGQPPYHPNQIHLVADIATDPLPPHLGNTLQALRVRSKLVVPIQYSVAPQQDQPERLWGLLIAHHGSSARQWHDTDAELLQQIAGQVAIGIYQADLYQQLQSANHQLALLATIDELTQLANRRHFDSYLQQEWQRLAREQESLSLVFCDVDYFKQYNDTYGHLLGDDCLMRVAAVMRQQVKRATDLVARYGGEEFAIILPNTTVEGAIQVVEAIQYQIRDLTLPHTTSPLEQRITLSFGITSCIPDPSSTPDDLIHRADQALYDAKDQGRDRYCIR